MLGLADRGRVLDLFEAVLRGDAAGALTELAAQYADGADPAAVLRDLAEVTHWVSVVKVTPQAAGDPTVLARRAPPRHRPCRATVDRGSCSECGRCSSRRWKRWRSPQRDDGRRDGADPPDPRRRPSAARRTDPQAAIHPRQPCPRRRRASPDTRHRGGGGPRGPCGRVACRGAGRCCAGSAPALAGFRDLRKRRRPDPREARHALLLAEVEGDLRLVRYSPGRIEFQPAQGAAPDLAQRLAARLQGWTGVRWVVSVTATRRRRHPARGRRGGA
jgi:DNA polymerase III subunit gamma/tau